MGSRLELQTLLEDILGSENVYYQPPESLQMSYPAIVYSLNNINGRYANDGVYIQDTAYKVVVIDYDPDSAIRDRISQLPRCRFDRHYKADNLNHYAFILYH